MVGRADYALALEASPRRVAGCNTRLAVIEELDSQRLQCQLHLAHGDRTAGDREPTPTRRP